MTEKKKPIAKFLGPPSFPTRQNLINTGISSNIMGMPQKFRFADGGNTFSQGRNIFINAPVCSAQINGPNLTSIRVDTNTPNCQEIIPNTNWSSSSLHTNRGRHTTGKSINGKKSYITSSDLYIQRQKNRAIGAGSTNRKGEEFSFKTNNKTNLNINNQALTRVRAGGAVAPPKKGAIANPNRTSGGGPRAVFGGGRCSFGRC